MSGANYPTKQQLVSSRDALIQRSRDFRRTAPVQLISPLQSVENRLATIVPNTPSIRPTDSLMYQDEIYDYSVLLDYLERWHSHNNDTLLSQQRKLVEAFISRALRQVPNLGNHDIFVLIDDRVAVNNQHGLGFNIVRLDRDFFNDPKHWCLCAHEIGAHIFKDAQFQPIYQPNLQPHMTDPSYQNAIQIWTQEFPPRRDGWFSEVYGDLYSCRITGPSFLLGFNDYISNQSPTIGDRRHPPPGLRITLMKEYLDRQKFPTIDLPDHTPLETLIPDLTIDDVISAIIPFKGPMNKIRDKIYDPVLINEAVRIADLGLSSTPWNTGNIRASFQAISSGNIEGNNLVADVSGLAMFLHETNDPVGPFVSQLIEAYL